MKNLLKSFYLFSLLAWCGAACGPPPLLSTQGNFFESYDLIRVPFTRDSDGVQEGVFYFFKARSIAPLTLVISTGNQRTESVGVKHEARFLVLGSESPMLVSNFKDSKYYVAAPTKNYEKRVSYFGGVPADLSFYTNFLEDFYSSHSITAEKTEISLATGVPWEVFDKRKFLIGNETSGGKFSQSVERNSKEVRRLLDEKWTELTKDEREVFFNAMLVSNLWGYGNKVLADRVGCVQVNETLTKENSDFVFSENSDGSKNYWKSSKGLQLFLEPKSDIGCCTDYAFLLKIALDFRKIWSERLIIPGHWLVQIYSKKNYYVVDPTFGVFLRGSIEQLAHGEERSAIIFPHRNHAKTFKEIKNVLGIGLSSGKEFKAEDVIRLTGYVDWKKFWKTSDAYANEQDQVDGK